VFLIPLAEQKQIYMVWPITFRAAILYTEIFVVERQNIYTDGGVKISNLGMSLRARGKFRLVVLVFVRIVNICRVR